MLLFYINGKLSSYIFFICFRFDSFVLLFISYAEKVLFQNSKHIVIVRLTQHFLHSKINGYATINRHYTVTEISSTRGTMATPPCFCHQNYICKSKIPLEGEPGIVAEFIKEVGVYISEICHILLITCRPVLFRVHYYFIHR
jgi:hypothetical protein